MSWTNAQNVRLCGSTAVRQDGPFTVIESIELLSPLSVVAQWTGETQRTEIAARFQLPLFIGHRSSLAHWR